jgi:diacylglycerol kinase (ATP)
MKEVNKKDFSWKMRLKSFSYAFKGIGFMFRTQHNSWFQAGFAVMAVFLGFYLKISRLEWLFIILCIGLVFMAEMLNTAIETLVDLVSPEKNEKAGRIKDLAAGSVLVIAFMAFVIGVIIFLPKLLEK